VLADRFDNFECSRKAAGNDAGVARAEFAGLALYVSNPDSAGDYMEEFLLVRIEGDTPGSGFAVPETG